MQMFGRKHKSEPEDFVYDPALHRPAMRCSICTGEKTAGFIERATGRFIDLRLIENDQQLQAFREQYGITQDFEKIY